VRACASSLAIRSGAANSSRLCRSRVDSEDALEIIVDRRRDESPAKPGLKEDRRTQRQVALSLKVHGFAIVPASVNPPIEHFLPAEDDETRLESIRSFQSRHRARSSRGSSA
jgi:hypothetical protein